MTDEYTSLYSSYFSFSIKYRWLLDLIGSLHKSVTKMLYYFGQISNVIQLWTWCWWGNPGWSWVCVCWMKQWCLRAILDASVSWHLGRPTVSVCVSMKRVWIAMLELPQLAHFLGGNSECSELGAQSLLVITDIF